MTVQVEGMGIIAGPPASMAGRGDAKAKSGMARKRSNPMFMFGSIVVSGWCMGWGEKWKRRVWTLRPDV